VGWSMRWKIVDPTIYATWIYDYALIIAICGQKEFSGSRLELGVLDRGSLEAMDTEVVLGRLVLLCKFDRSSSLVNC